MAGVDEEFFNVAYLRCGTRHRHGGTRGLCALRLRDASPSRRLPPASSASRCNRLEEAFGAPRKVDRTPTKLVYDWFLAQAPAGAPVGFHGCEMEVTVDIRSEHVLGYSLANIGWGRCQDVQRKIRIAEG